MNRDALSLRQRIIIAAAIVLAVFLVLLGVSRWFGEAEAQALIPKATPWDARMLELDREALDEAYKDVITHLFEVFVRGDADQPGRTIIGAAKARRSYAQVMEAIERREKLLKAEPK